MAAHVQPIFFVNLLWEIMDAIIAISRSIVGQTVKLQCPGKDIESSHIALYHMMLLRI